MRLEIASPTTPTIAVQVAAARGVERAPVLDVAPPLSIAAMLALVLCTAEFLFYHLLVAAVDRVSEPITRAIAVAHRHAG